MAEVKAFQGVRYNPEKAGSAMFDLVCPPYDVISPEAQKNYMQRSQYNAIHLELGEIRPTDDTTNNRYTRAAADLDAWLRAGVLFQEEQPAYYLYEQEFNWQNQTYRRRSLMAAVKLHRWDENVVLPHEHTLAKPKADRLALLEATRTNFSPIFSLYSDADGKIATAITPQANSELLYEFKDEAGDINRLWKISDPNIVQTIEQAFADKQLYIADGHHRYETALAYRDAQRQAGQPEGGPADYLMMTLTALEDEGLLVLPYHRLIHSLSAEELEQLEQNLPHYFGTEETSVQGEAAAGSYMSELVQKLNDENADGQRNHVYGMYGAEPDSLTTLKLKSEESATELMPPHSEAWQRLDVSIFQTVVLEGCLGMSRESITQEEKLSYTRDADDAVAKVQRGEIQRLFLLPATRVSDLIAVADAHDQMPPKSTYFYPKFLTGIVMRSL